MRRTIILTTTLLLLTPAAAAIGWGSKGDWEPSTKRDAQDGYMWTTPPQTVDGAVYFNGWLSSSGGAVVPDTNPNVGVARTGIMSPGNIRAWAMLGVWLDCNKDGYVGYGEQGLLEYPVQLLGDTTLCPPVPAPDPARLPAYGYRPVHNDAKWVHEFIPLGWEEWRTQWDTSDDQNHHFVVKQVDDQPFDFNDTDARVWFDFGMPESKFSGGTGCALNPQPRGTFQRTGGLVESVDCLTVPESYLVTDTLNDNSGLLDSTPAGQVSFKDKPRDQSESRSILNQRNPWGNESDAEYVDTWDCTKDQVRVHDPTSNQADDYLLNVSQPKAPTGVNAGGSPSGQVNATQGGFNECKRSPKGENDAMDPYILEGDVVNSAKKVETSDALTYVEGYRRGGPIATTLGTAAPYDAGAHMTGYESCVSSSTSVLSDRCHEGFWVGDTNWVVATGPYVNTATQQPSGVYRTTFYAFVGSAATSRYSLRFPGVVGSYGAENCALPANEQLFECDATKWWPKDSVPRTADLGKDPADASKPLDDQRDRPYGVKVGQAYQLRDIDCWDHSASALRDQGVTYGTLSNSICP